MEITVEDTLVRRWCGAADKSLVSLALWKVTVLTSQVTLLFTLPAIVFSLADAAPATCWQGGQRAQWDVSASCTSVSAAPDELK